MIVEIMTLGLSSRTKTIVSRNSWATQMCWNTVIWLMRTDEKDMPDFPLNDEPLRIDKRKCWAKEAHELIREDQIRHVVDRHYPVKRAKTDVDRLREDKRENIDKKVRFQRKSSQSKRKTSPYH